MSQSYRISLPLLTCLLAIPFLLWGCSQNRGRALDADNTAGADLSGAWELDYSQSDNIQAELNAMVRELRRQAERRAKAQGDSRSGGMASSGTDSGASVVGLARMADYITQSQLLDIEQGEHEIQIKREENFALTCEFHGGKSQEVRNPLGREICGWDQHQLVFWIVLPEGLRINHRFSMGPSGERLNIATTVVSDRVSYPFTLNRVYNRYDPEAEGFSCEMTLTRGKVCTTESK